MALILNIPSLLLLLLWLLLLLLLLSCSNLLLLVLTLILEDNNVMLNNFSSVIDRPATLDIAVNGSITDVGDSDDVGVIIVFYV